jgi:succinyl-CoA synthetase alpha subunit
VESTIKNSANYGRVRRCGGVRAGTRFSHAGAIIEGGRGTHAGKVKALREAGATVVGAFGELPSAVVEILKRMKGQSLFDFDEI